MYWSLYYYITKLRTQLLKVICIIAPKSTIELGSSIDLSWAFLPVWEISWLKADLRWPRLGQQGSFPGFFLQQVSPAGVLVEDLTTGGRTEAHTVPPKGPAGNWRPSPPLPSGAHAGYSPRSKERENGTILGKGLWNHIANNGVIGRGWNLEPVLQWRVPTSCLSA